MMSDPLSQIPGNDDSGAIAALLTFHILGLYPVPSTRQFLLNSPMVSSFKLRNDLFGTTTKFTVSGFDPTSLAATPPSTARIFVTNVTLNGRPQNTICSLQFEDIVGGGEIVITVDADADAASERGCEIGRAHV